MRMQRRRGPGRERARKAHFMNFKAKDNSVLIIHSLGIISVTLPFVDLKNREITVQSAMTLSCKCQEPMCWPFCSLTYALSKHSLLHSLCCALRRC